MNLDLLCYVLAFIAFTMGALKVQTAIDLFLTGLAFLTLSLIV